MMRWSVPWSDAQILALEAWQRNDQVHPYTCGHDSNHALLVPTREGWVCSDCDYAQDWAHNLALENK